MKYIVILGDGMSDREGALPDGRTPLEAAEKPNMDALCRRGRAGLMRTLYEDLPSGSDTAHLSVLGYDPHRYYTGRSPIEALGLGIPLEETDLVFRMNLVTLSEGERFEDRVMVDHSAGKISDGEAEELVSALAAALNSEAVSIHPGVSYRHVFILKNPDFSGFETPPHDILNKKIGGFLPRGSHAGLFLDMMKKSTELLSAHPVNKRRAEKGQNQANCLWLWGEGKKPDYESFESKYGVKKGAVITAVPLISGLAAGMGLEFIPVEGATGDYHTNYKGKAAAGLKALEDGAQFVFIHIEAPDECGHDGDAELKKAAIERIDDEVVGPVRRLMDSSAERFRVLILPDHATPVSLRTHTLDPVPFIFYDSGEVFGAPRTFNEKTAAGTGLFIEDGHTFMKEFLTYGAD